MLIYEKDNITSPTAVALGFFDGVHKGHASLIHEIKKLENSSVKSLIYTLDTHPSFFFGNPIKMITPEQTRIDILESFNTDYIYLQKTDKEFLNIEPEQFVTEILLKKLNAKYVVSGENYTFGKNKSGNSLLLKKLCEENDIKCMIVPYLKDGESIVSSSLIRQRLSEGNIPAANNMLGRKYFLSGKVVRCRQIGTSLGFPTANLLPCENAQLPISGVYATTTIVDGISYPSITNVGNAPTFNENKLIIESHILDFNEDIYSKNITIEFLELIRAPQKFSSPELLVKQLEIDKEKRRTLCKV